MASGHHDLSALNINPQGDVHWNLTGRELLARTQRAAKKVSLPRTAPFWR